MDQEIRKIILEQLKPEQMVMVATCDGDQPKVRPMTLIYKLDEFFLATGSWDKKADQIALNPRLEICLLIKGESSTGYIRACGKLETVSDPEIRKAIFETTDFLHYYWDKSEDDGFILYQMQWQQAEYMKPGENTSTTIEWHAAD